MIPVPRRAGTVIIGGGIAGVALASELGALGARNVVVLEREASLGEGATGRSAGGIRQQFADPAGVVAARDTVRILDTFEEDTGVDPGFRRHGYLLLATDPERARRLREEAALQRSLGLDVETLEGDALRERFPCLDTGDVLAANFCGDDGYLSPHDLVEGYRARAIKAGVRFTTGVVVHRIVHEGGRVTGVATSGGTVATARVVVAAGAGAGPLLKEAGVAQPLRPTLRRIWATHPLPQLPVDLPLVLDLDNPFYFRPESGGALLSLAEVEEGGVPERMEEEDGVGALPERLAERALSRAPVLADARVLRGWSGHRTLTPDDRPVVGQDPRMPGLWLAVGFGGHGITHAPSLCRALAEEMEKGAAAYTSLEPFRPGRDGLASPGGPSGVI